MKSKQQYLDEIFNAKPLSLGEILDNKEARVTRQQRMMEREEGTLISFTMNIVGAVKSSPLFTMAFNEGKRQILRELYYERTRITAQEEYNAATGNELYLMVDADIITVKKLMAAVEESSSIGRLYDIDVMNKKIPKISRQDIGFEPRRCLVCGERAAACARSQAHSVRELMNKTVEIIWDYFAHLHADNIAAKACRALLYEVHISPKPGLVDRENNGSHRDMDEFTFIDSACSLYPYFKSCVLKGIEMNDRPQELFTILRCLGKEAEERMKKATNGINTHKGAIFSMGIFSGAVGSTVMPAPDISVSGIDNNISEGNISREMLSSFCREMCKGLMDDFAGVEKKQSLSYGERLYLKYGITGIRSEAAEGFPSVFNIGLPTLERELACGKTINAAAVKTLIALIAEVQDTNIITRSDMDTLLWAQRRAREVLDGGCTEELVRQLDSEFVEKNISPGGCADLLALCLFLQGL